MKPYTEKLLSENKRVRKFSSDVDPMLLEWHQDKRDRVVKVLEGTGWKFQLDDSVPVNLSPGSTFNVPAFTWHRIIKGEDDLVIKITEAKFKKGDKVKWSGGKGVVKVPNARGDLVGVDPEGGDEMDMVPEKELSLIKERKKKKSTLKKMKKRKLPSQYGAEPGTKRRKALDRAAAAYAAGDVKKAAKIADAENKKQRKKGISQRKRHDTGKYTEGNMTFEERMNDMIEEIKLDNFLEELFTEVDAEDLMSELSGGEFRLDEKRKKGKSPKGLSAAVKKSLDKKADRRCLTRGSVYSEFRKGLAAYLSSGSRKGMSAHQWAHARVNSAQPSKSWATVKKRKKCPKKKK